jgi:hypothetical protein
MNHKKTEPNCQRSDQVAAASYGKLKSGIARLKAALQAQYVNAFPSRLGSIKRAIAAAEASAWSTPFPSLFFLALARIRLHELGSPAATDSTFSQRSQPHPANL